MKNDISKLMLIIAGFIFMSILGACSKKEKDSPASNSINVAKKEVIKIAMEKAENNSSKISNAIENCPEEQMEGLLFLLENMPERDLKSLSDTFLLENINLAYKVRDSVNWGKKIPQDIFLNYVLPYANIHERRDNWRLDFVNQFLPLVKNLNTPSEGLLKLNNDMWDILNVHYSTKRPKADQSPYESIDAGLASCTGLSILLIDACRAVGIPARFVGVPLWKDHSGNHSWIEIWDNGWHFIGAAEPGQLNDTWFEVRAALADDTNWKYSIYAVSFQKTNVIFPPLFDSTATYVYADIITERYNKELADDGMISLAVRLYDRKNGNRIKGNIKVMSNEDTVGTGESKDEKHDYNDFLVFRLKPMQTYNLIAESSGIKYEKTVKTDNSKFQFVEIYLNE